MKFAIALLICFASPLANAQSLLGNDRGNGGDPCELSFISIRNDIRQWIIRGGSAVLQFPANLSLNQYNTSMVQQIDSAVISCTEEKLTIGSSEKTCVNYRDKQGRPMITCNLRRFTEAGEAAQYVLVHHEYAGLAGMEVNNGEASDYRISSQISVSVIKPPTPIQCLMDSSLPDSQKLLAAIYKDDVNCVKFLAPLMSLNQEQLTKDYFPNQSWGYSMPPLSFAAVLDRTEVIKALLDAGAYIHIESQGTHPVTFAAKSNALNALRLLVQRGAFINFTSPNSFNPLAAAIANIKDTSIPLNKTYETVKTILSLGANPNLLSFGKSPLGEVCEYPAFIDLLISFGGNPSALNSMGRTPLFNCSTKACVDKFVALGVDVNLRDVLGNRAIDWITIPEVINALAANGSKPKTKTHATPKVGDQAIYKVTMKSKSKTVVATWKYDLTKIDNNEDSATIHIAQEENGKVKVQEIKAPLESLASDFFTECRTNPDTGFTPVDVTVPAGTFKACTGKYIDSPPSQQMWMAADVPIFGLVKLVSNENGTLLTQELVSFSLGK
ncbi:ankyrin repeat domain-containing protein [Bdellovibrio sp. HCB274]|uniref:ankyrin repeat domain-containing protein n=1 Tax=Bdellovibrio sp. HCB274 TaxID=3394361 RepID=UPI0039B390DF